MSVIGLLKFGELCNLERLVAHGELYFNTVEYFSRKDQVKTGSFRFDRFEGTSHILQAKDIKNIRIGTMDIEPAPRAGPMLVRTSNGPYFSHICCFSMISESFFIDGIERVFDPRMFNFGKSLAAIVHMKALTERISDYVKNSTEVEFLAADKVKYFNAGEYSGHTGIFQKADEYSYQNEYRIALKSSVQSAFIMRLGPLQDIVLGPVEETRCINQIQDHKALLW